MNFKQIIEAWIISFNPTPEQKEMAEKRYKICNECSSHKLILSIPTCNECGCPIAKKVFTNEFNPCPLHKWGDVDEPYMKRNKTLI